VGAREPGGGESKEGDWITDKREPRESCLIITFSFFSYIMLL
jgi:hypothetical protein